MINHIRSFRRATAAISEKGSLALEQILFIGAIVALSAGLFIFYDNLSNYFSNVGFANPPANIGSQSAPNGSN